MDKDVEIAKEILDAKCFKEMNTEDDPYKCPVKPSFNYPYCWCCHRNKDTAQKIIDAIKAKSLWHSTPAL